MTEIDVSRLPRRTLAAGTRLYRIHRRERDPWHFDGSGAGRFDPVGVASLGACCWAEQPTGAWIEVFRSTMLLTESDLAMRCLSVIELTDPVRVADLTAARALAAGVTASTTAGADYTDSHALARALHDQADGVRWRLRHDLSARRIGVALFGPRGATSRTGRARLPRPTTTPISPRVVSSACSTFGYVVLPDPPS